MRVNIAPEAVQALQNPQPVVQPIRRDAIEQLQIRDAEVRFIRVADFHRTLRGWAPTAAELIAPAKDAGLDGLDVDGRGPVDAAFAQQVHDAGLRLYIWTVDAPAKARRLLAAGVDGLTTNRPGWLRTQLKSNNG